MTMHCHIDFETRSDVDIRSHGVYRYMDSANTEPLFASYKIGDGPVQRWSPGQPCPIPPEAIVVAHNAGFERLLIQKVLHTRHAWPWIPNERFVCTAATAAALSLPRDLAGLGAALGLPIQKDGNGYALIRKFSIPRKPRKGEPPGLYFNRPEDFPEDWEAFKRYCDKDVETEALAHARMVALSSDEQAVYQLSERINDRGMRIDTLSVNAALAMAARAKEKLDREITLLTGGYITSCTQVAELKNWIASQGVDVTSLAKAEIEDWLALEDLPERVRKALTLRQEAGKTSVSKLESFRDRVSADGRVRGAFLYCGAGTGRWSSTGVQMHNMPRPRVVYAEAKLDLATLFDAIRHGDPDIVQFMYGEELGRPLSILADSIRSFIWAAPGHEILAADYSGIEGAVAAWFAGEQWKVDALFGLIKDPTLPDLYRRAAAAIYNTDVANIPKKDNRRQVGKVAELSLQYQGGPGAFRSMARNYAMKLDPIFDPAWEAATPERRAKAEKRYETVLAQKLPIGEQLTRREFLAAELVKIGWRTGHPAIVNSWEALAEAAREATASPGVVSTALMVKYVVKHGFLWCRLPSGRCLAYGAPRIKRQVWVKKRGSEEAETMGYEEAERAQARGEVTIESEAKPSVTAMGVNSVTKKWERYALYGGLLLENVVQAISRDLLANGMLKAEAAGYPVIGHVHDEIITEVVSGYGNVKDFEKLICELPPWAEGLPLTASGFRHKRYQKD